MTQKKKIILSLEKFVETGSKPRGVIDGESRKPREVIGAVKGTRLIINRKWLYKKLRQRQTVVSERRQNISNRTTSEHIRNDMIVMDERD